MLGMRSAGIVKEISMRYLCTAALLLSLARNVTRVIAINGFLLTVQLMILIIRL